MIERGWQKYIKNNRNKVIVYYLSFEMSYVDFSVDRIIIRWKKESVEQMKNRMKAWNIEYLWIRNSSNPSLYQEKN